jgi:hypothetical protein
MRLAALARYAGIATKVPTVKRQVYIPDTNYISLHQEEVFIRSSVCSEVQVVTDFILLIYFTTLCQMYVILCRMFGVVGTSVASGCDFTNVSLQWSKMESTFSHPTLHACMCTYRAYDITLILFASRRCLKEDSVYNEVQVSTDVIFLILYNYLSNINGAM